MKKLDFEKSSCKIFLAKKKKSIVGSPLFGQLWLSEKKRLRENFDFEISTFCPLKKWARKWVRKKLKIFWDFSLKKWVGSEWRQKSSLKFERENFENFEKKTPLKFWVDSLNFAFYMEKLKSTLEFFLEAVALGIAKKVITGFFFFTCKFSKKNPLTSFSLDQVWSTLRILSKVDFNFSFIFTREFWKFFIHFNKRVFGNPHSL